MESAGLGNRLLPYRRVDCQYDLVGLDRRGNSLHLVHQVPLVPVPSCSIDNHDVGLLLPIMVETMPRDVLRLLVARLTVNWNLDCRC